MRLSHAWVLAVLLLAGCDSTHPVLPVLAPTPPPVSSCLPVIAESGFATYPQQFPGADQTTLTIGLIIRDPCPQALAGAAIGIGGLNSAGRVVTDPTFAQLPLLLPGQQTGVAATAAVIPDIGTPVSLRLTVQPGNGIAVTELRTWAKSATARDVSFHNADDGSTVVEFTVAVDPAGAAVCGPSTTLIMRDSTGRIVGGFSSPDAPSPDAVRVRFPPNADRSRTQIFIHQGGDPQSGAFLNDLTCTGGKGERSY